MSTIGLATLTLAAGWTMTGASPPNAMVALAPFRPDLGRDKEPVEITITTASGLKYVELKIGDGKTAKAGDVVVVHFVGTFPDGKKFDSSRDRGQPFSFELGAGKVIKGFDEGIVGINQGGTRRLILPANLGYGERGAGNAIPPNATFIFEVELLKVK